MISNKVCYPIIKTQYVCVHFEKKILMLLEKNEKPQKPLINLPISSPIIV